jgi:glycosyltransferase involved in cell wall biosynthesis
MRHPLYVDVSPLLSKRLTGIGRYAARLVDRLARRAPLRLITGVSYGEVCRLTGRPVLYGGVEIRVDPDTAPPGEGVEVHRWRDALFSLPVSAFDAPRAAESAGLYVFLRAPSRLFRRELGVVFDFTPVLLPETHLPAVRESFGTYCAKHMRLYDKVIAISHATRWDAQWLCDVPDSDIVVAYPGPSQCLDGHAHPAPARRRRDLLVVVSTLEPRKNADFLLDWFLDSPAVRPGSELWWVGPEGWLLAPRGRLRGRRADRRVKFLGMVSDRQLCRLYQEAACTVYPSLYEGFGFPVLDSLMHGTPVLCSFNSSLREFAGPGVYYFDPCERESLDEAYRELVSSPAEGVERRDLQARCSWDRVADTVFALAG